jgi:hypothetical protein
MKNFMSSLKISDQVLSGILTFIFGVILYGMLFGFTYYRVLDSRECFLDICLLNLGVACGWLLGIYVSPDTQAEAERFTRLGTAVGSFLTGYVLSKSDKLLEWVFVPGHWSYDVAFRFILWLSGLLIAGLASYTLREYILTSPNENTQSYILLSVAATSRKLIDLPSSISPTSRLHFLILKGKGPVTIGRVTDANVQGAPTVNIVLTGEGSSSSVTEFSALGAGPVLIADNGGAENVSLRVEVVKAT